MIPHTCKIDAKGRITLPKEVLEALKIFPDVEITLECTQTSIILTPKQHIPPVTASIAEMVFPVTEWTQMEQEMKEGRQP